MHDLTAREVAEVVSRAVALLTCRGQGLLADGLDECLRRARDREHLVAAPSEWSAEHYFGEMSWPPPDGGPE